MPAAQEIFSFLSLRSVKIIIFRTQQNHMTQEDFGEV